jgi:hypothetical protein
VLWGASTRAYMQCWMKEPDWWRAASWPHFWGLSDWWNEITAGEDYTVCIIIIISQYKVKYCVHYPHS